MGRTCSIRLCGLWLGFVVAGSALFPCPGWTQLARIKKVGKFEGKGTVVDIQPGEITISDEQGIRQSFIIQHSDERAISLDGNDYIISMPARIAVSGSLPVNLLEQGMQTSFRSTVNRFGKPGQPVSSLEVATENTDPLGILVDTDPTGGQFVDCQVTGRVIYFRRGKLYLQVPKSQFAKRERITFRVPESATFQLSSKNLNRVRKGDTVAMYKGDKMENGANVIRQIKIELTAKRETATASYSDTLYQKFSNYSDEPGQPRTERSENFILHTDISQRSARVLLAKLENMYELVFRYYNKRPREKIECFVVRDLDNFSGKINAVGASKIAQGTGVTISQRFALIRGNRQKGKKTTSVVYCCDDHSVVQHEAVHAFCAMAFGSTGPVWYAEGMAELGQYWKPDNLAVEVDAVVIEYLTSAKKKRMKDIVAAGQITGDSWKAYAWRWALCHLLANNPNYSRRFKRLGMNMMAEQGDSFKKAFGSVADQISFEYDQFINNFDNGYRADLCVWDWSTEAKKLTNSKPVKTEISAQAGWQATPIEVRQGDSYDVICQGMWKVDNDSDEIDADGRPSGRGRLIGAILNDYQLSKPFELGKKARFVAPKNGQLFVRCKDDWNSLADNSGELTVFVRKSPQKSK